MNFIRPHSHRHLARRAAKKWRRVQQIGDELTPDLWERNDGIVVTRRDGQVENFVLWSSLVW